ncbi:hypothetical protein [Agromyces larvae]|uniref:BIG2 domain-containing protein n=1 Tax=Agromyces larvae TaxID=2929802 RepID=A0ABY4C6R3_9MICO|nr:hypothetical protein [Agromyces larvae]UOE45886.1 hypothetical protein MTO99_09145 [Agromyces larvae]
MTDVRAQSNKAVGWFAGPDTAITDDRWVSGPTLAELQSLLNISAETKIDGTDFGLEASEQSDDRSFADAAGAQSRSFDSASGSIEIFTPSRGETSGLRVQVWNTLAKPRTKLAIAQRFITNQAAAIAPGQVVNLFRVITDDRQHNRNDVSRTLGIGLVLQDNLLSNYVVPSAVPTAVTLTPDGEDGFDVVVGTPLYLKATYEGVNVTVGADYASSDENIFTVTKHGILIPRAAGTATLTVSIAGSAAGTPIDVTVTAP